MKNIKAILILLSTLAFVLSPFFVSDFSGFSSDQLPYPQVKPPIQPAGYAFSIWGLIYLWLLISAIFGLVKRANDEHWQNYRVPLIVSVLVGSTWLPVALASAEWATVLIFIMLISSLIGFLRTDVKDSWLLQTPIAIYAAWLTAASSVSLGIILAGYGLLSANLAAYVGLSVAVLLAFCIQFQKPHARAYGLTIIWALIAIVIANNDKNLGVQLYAGTGAMLMLGLLLVFFYRKPANG